MTDQAIQMDPCCSVMLKVGGGVIRFISCTRPIGTSAGLDCEPVFFLKATDPPELLDARPYNLSKPSLNLSFMPLAPERSESFIAKTSVKF